jgi:hypothetical protein
MKKSELILTGDTYRTTPVSWGEEYIMVDEVAAASCMDESFDDGPHDPDADPNDTPDTVDIAVDARGNYYAILHPYEETSWGHKTGEMFNENMYRPCQNPETVDSDGVAVFYTGRWEIFDDEEG